MPGHRLLNPKLVDAKVAGRTVADHDPEERACVPRTFLPGSIGSRRPLPR